MQPHVTATCLTSCNAGNIMQSCQHGANTLKAGHICTEQHWAPLHQYATKDFCIEHKSAMAASPQHVADKGRQYNSNLTSSMLQEADSVMADIRLQLARYAQGIHWVQKNFMLDESITAVLVTAGPMDLPAAQQPSLQQPAHVVLQMQPDFDVPFQAPESWNQQVIPCTCIGCSCKTCNP